MRFVTRTGAGAAGRFIVFEGLDGVGKSTQAHLLADRLGALLTREPGGTAIGSELRGLLLDPKTEGLSIRAEALMMAADRAQHAEQIVRPALVSGRHVVSDRYLGSSVAYQGYGRGLDPLEVRRLSEWATGGLEADLVLLLEAPLALARSRRAGDADRLESNATDFWERVGVGFARQASEEPERWAVLDASGPVAKTAQAVWDAVRNRLSL